MFVLFSIIKNRKFNIFLILILVILILMFLEFLFVLFLFYIGEKTSIVFLKNININNNIYVLTPILLKTIKLIYPPLILLIGVVNSNILPSYQNYSSFNLSKIYLYQLGLTALSFFIIELFIIAFLIIIYYLIVFNKYDKIKKQN
jgi:hypothetical protein